MPSKKFKSSLRSIDWNGNIDKLLNDDGFTSRISKCSYKLAIWSKEFEQIDQDNPALAFIREMQQAGHHTAMLIALAIYKPAAASMRTILETGLYYSYFRTHHEELATLARNYDWHIQKKDIIEYHKTHTPGFSDNQNRFNLLDKLNKLYSRISAIIHGQIPGGWTSSLALADTKHNDKVINDAIDTFEQITDVVHIFFLCTVGKALWGGFSTEAKKYLLKGIPGDKRSALGLDKA